MLRKRPVYLRLVSTAGLAGALLALPALAQQPAVPKELEGWWHGTIQNYPHDPKPDRELFVGADGKCLWDYAKPTKTRGHDTAACTIDAAKRSIEVRTTGRSRVSLRLEGDELKGYFGMAFGSSEIPFTLAMQRGRKP